MQDQGLETFSAGPKNLSSIWLKMTSYHHQLQQPGYLFGRIDAKCSLVSIIIHIRNNSTKLTFFNLSLKGCCCCCCCCCCFCCCCCCCGSCCCYCCYCCCIHFITTGFGTYFMIFQILLFSQYFPSKLRLTHAH